MLETGARGLIPIKNCGLGCVLIKTEIFKKLEEPWVQIGQMDKEGWSDDIHFFNRVTALGYEMFCDLEVQCGHVGQLIMWPKRNADGSWSTVYDTQGVQAVQIHQLSFAEFEAEVNKHKAGAK